MIAPLQRPSYSFQPALKRDLLQRTAAPVLVFRVAEGLGAWLLFTQTAFRESLLHYGSAAWLVHALLLTYFAVNLFCYMRYRTGRGSDMLLWIDLVVNLGTMLVVSGHTGGLASPVVVICLIKIAAYGFVFSPLIGMIAIVLTIGGVSIFVAGTELLGIDWMPGDSGLHAVEPAVTLLFRFSLVTGALIASTWLFNQVAETEHKTTVETGRAKRFADREHAAATITAALLSVSEAVSRLTHLDEVLNKVVDIAPRVLSVDYCAIFLWNEERSVYSGAAVSGVEPTAAQELLGLRLRPEEVPDLEWVRRLGHCAVIGPREAERIGVTGALALLTAPLLSGGRFYGALLFARRSGRSFNQSDLRLADGIAGQAAVAIERARLVAESHRLVRAVESTDEAVLITDRHRRIVFANPAFVSMLGYTWEELAGRDSLTLGLLTAHSLTEVQSEVVKRAWRGEATAQRKDGTPIPVALHASVIRSADNEIEGAVAILEDITVQKQMQEQLARADRLAAAGELAAGVAHEVNNALVGILGQADLAHSATDIDTLRAALSRVEVQGRRIADIVQDLLGFARPQVPQRVAIDLNQLVNDTLALMAHDLGRRGIRTEAQLAADLPTVSADGQQIQQVLVNLFTNAMQAMETSGGGVLTVSLRPMKDAVDIEVHDNGPGIPADVLPRVFDPFVSTKPKGTGLGLSVSYAIVRAHGGDLTVHSTPGVGTTFTLQLPAVIAAADTPAAMSVLLVDDDNEVAATLRDMLTRMNVSVSRVATGAEALATLATDTFDAIFLDVRLPDISGPEIYARLATERPELARRVAFVTGGLWRSDNRLFREQLPPQPTLSKPCTAAQIREVLRLLRDARAAA